MSTPRLHHRLNRSAHLFTRADMLGVLLVKPVRFNFLMRAGLIPPPTTLILPDLKPDASVGKLERWSRQDILAWMSHGMLPVTEWVELKKRLRRELLEHGIIPPDSPEMRELTAVDGMSTTETMLAEYLERLSGRLTELTIEKIDRNLYRRRILLPEDSEENEHEGE